MADTPKAVIGHNPIGHHKFSVNSEPPTLAAGYRTFPDHASAHAAAKLLADGNGWELVDKTGGAS